MSFSGQVKALFFLSAREIAHDQFFNTLAAPVHQPPPHSAIGIRERILAGEKVKLGEKSILIEYLERYAPKPLR